MPIVAAVDQSERAESVLEQARDLADAYGVALHVVFVGRFSIGHAEGNVRAGDIYDARDEAEEIAAEIGRRILDPEEFEAVGLAGEPVGELLEYSAEHDAEYIVVSARKRTPVGKALFGSVTQSLLLNADRPIVAVPHDGETE